MSFNKPKINKKVYIRNIIIAVCVLGGAFTCKFLIDTMKTYEVNSKATQYYLGVEAPINEGSKLYRNSDEDTILKSDKDDMVITSIPLYFDDDKMVIPQTMAYYNPEANINNKVDYFTELYIKDSGVFASRNGKEVQLTGGFLYDCKDLYIFLEPVTLEQGGLKYKFDKLSYVEGIYREYVAGFDYQSKEPVMNSVLGEATITSDNGIFTIDILNDTLTTEGGSSLLVATADVYDRLF